MGFEFLGREHRQAGSLKRPSVRLNGERTERQGGKGLGGERATVALRDSLLVGGDICPSVCSETSPSKRARSRKKTGERIGRGAGRNVGRSAGPALPRSPSRGSPPAQAQMHRSDPQLLPRKSRLSPAGVERVRSPSPAADRRRPPAPQQSSLAERAGRPGFCPPLRNGAGGVPCGIRRHLLQDPSKPWDVTARSRKSAPSPGWGPSRVCPIASRTDRCVS